MCGRFALARSPDEITRVFHLTECADFSPRYNIAPGTAIPTIRRSPQGDSVLHLLHWGLVPHWSKDPTIGNRLIVNGHPNLPSRGQRKIPTRVTLVK